MGCDRLTPVREEPEMVLLMKGILKMSARLYPVILSLEAGSAIDNTVDVVYNNLDVSMPLAIGAAIGMSNRFPGSRKAMLPLLPLAELDRASWLADSAKRIPLHISEINTGLRKTYEVTATISPKPESWDIQPRILPFLNTGLTRCSLRTPLG